ncbi:MAG: tRNA pseudouridine(55) synthase TruB [Candidatus Cloacimonadota bacterium]|nr:tRNA pseudouridine(55) synthase TruB [Candidatus Cloacimonadota bacterium]
MSIHGVFLIDKPAGITSFGVIKKLRGITRIKKMGHAGTLDPMATGLLPIFVGKATRAVNLFLNDKKEYLVTMKLGIQTDTGDMEGSIISQTTYEKQLPPVNEIKKISSQIPPNYSAIKYNGQKAYKLARKRVEFKLPERKIQIHEFQFNEIAYPLVCYSAVVSKGTYVRALSQQIAHMIHTCATTTSIRRTKIGETNIEKAVSLDKLDINNWKSHLLPLEFFFKKMPRIHLSEKWEKNYKNGMQIKFPKTKNGFYMVLNQRESCIGFGKLKDEVLQPKMVMI